MRYFINPGNFLEVEFSSKKQAQAYAVRLFKEGCFCFCDRWFPQNEGYRKPADLVESRWDSLEEMYKNLP